MTARLLGAIAAAFAVAALVGCGATSHRSATVETHAATKCALRTGPGDTLIHSADFRVANVSCDVGWRVALACAIEFGKSGACMSGGSRWRCTSRRLGLGGTERCTAGDRLMRITWLD